METRAEHLEWCKERAREYLDRGELSDAVASMLSDMGKHPETSGSAERLAPIGMFELMTGDPGRVRSFIEGFN